MDILLIVMAFFALLGLADDLLNGKLGLAPKFNIGLAIVVAGVLVQAEEK